MQLAQIRTLPVHALKLALTVTASAILLACGGGGGNNSSTGSPAQATADPRSQKLLVNWEAEADTSYNLFWSTDPALEPENYASYANSGMAADIQPPYTLGGLENNRNYYLFLETGNGTNQFSERFGTRPNSAAVTGTVNAIEQDSQGNLYLGGDFQSVGYNVGGLIALDRATELPTHSPYVGGLVTAVEPDGSGGYYVAGLIHYADDQEVHNIIRLNSDLSVDTSWNVTTDDLIYAMIVEPDRILLGGTFDEVNGFERHGLAAINHDGEVLDFIANVGTAPDYNGLINDLVVTENHIIVGGSFSNIGGETRDNLVALTPEGNVDTSWQADTDDQVTRIVANGDKLYIGGYFETVGGSSRIVVAALDADGTVLDYDPEITSGGVNVITVIDDVIYIGGSFEGPSDYLLATDADGNQVAIAAGEPDNIVTLVRELDGNILISGIFNEIGGVSRVGMALLNNQGELQESQQTGIQAAYDIHDDGDTLLIGSILAPNYQTVRSDNLTKLTQDGDIAEWETGLNDVVNALAQQGDTLYVGGDFTATSASVARTRLAAFDMTDGTLDNTWTPQADFEVHAMVARSGELHVGGDFTDINGSGQAYLATLDANGQFIDRMPEPNNVVTTITRDGSNLYIGGQFLTIDGNPRVKVAAVNSADGDLLAWAPSLTVGAGSMLVRALDVFNGTVYIGGRFDEAEGNSRPNLAAYDTAGALLPWNPNADGDVDSLLANAGGIRVSGIFEQVGGTDAGQLAVIGDDGDVLVVPERAWQPTATTMIEVDGGFCLGALGSFIINGQVGGGIACLDDEFNWLW